jgi:hypothetical protein
MRLIAAIMSAARAIGLIIGGFFPFYASLLAMA